MRYLKMLGLAAVAALAAMAFVGASSASADSLCEVNVGHANKCEAPLALGTKIEGLTTAANPAILLVNLEPKMECHSKTTGLVGENEGSHLGRWGLISTLTFSNCTGLCLKAAGENLPYLTLLFALSPQLHVIVNEHSEGKRPAALLTGCSFLKLNCLYELVEGKALLDISGDTLVANKEPLLRSNIHSDFCPESGEWDATYLVTLEGDLNKPVYATSLP